MNWVALLWLALVQTFYFATASVAVRSDDAGGRIAVRAGESREHDLARWIGPTADAPVPGIRVPLRVPVQAERAEAWRSPLPVSHGSGSSASAAGRVHAWRIPLTWRKRDRFALETHRLASRGSLLPYFPTAPPRRA